MNYKKIIVVKSRPFVLDSGFEKYKNYVKSLGRNFIESAIDSLPHIDVEFGKEESVQITYTLANKTGFTGTFYFIPLRNEAQSLKLYAKSIEDSGAVDCKTHDELHEYLRAEHGDKYWDFCIDEYSEVSVGKNSVNLVCFNGVCRYYENE